MYFLSIVLRIYVSSFVNFYEGKWTLIFSSLFNIVDEIREHFFN